jgi:hypothetical protein
MHFSESSTFYSLPPTFSRSAALFSDRPNSPVVSGVFVDEAGSFRRQILLWKNSSHWAFINTQTTVNAGGRINEKLIALCEVRFVLRGMDAINRANRNTCRVFYPDTGLGNNVGHNLLDLGSAATR